MYKLGLKLWSINTDYYYEEAKRLYSQGVFDYIELYVVPNTLDTLPKWKEIGIPFTLHAPHFNHGINLADKEKCHYNKNCFEEIFKAADYLQAQYIIFHPGVLGDIHETVRQLKTIHDARMIVENKPPYQIPSMRLCRGACIDEIKMILSEINVGFCLDIGHAICSANYFQKDPYTYLADLEQLKPVYYHLVDNFIDSSEDRHLNFGLGNYDLDRILNHILNKSNPFLLETNKASTTDLEDFVRDTKYIKEIMGKKHD